MEDPKQQLQVIKEILAERTQFHALSGISGVLAGIYALAAAYVSYVLIGNYDVIEPTLLLTKPALIYSNQLTIQLVILAIVVLLLSIGTGLYFSYKKANGKLWTNATKVLVKEFSLIMSIGGIVVIGCLLRGYVTLIAPFCLVFYGLALIHVAYMIKKEIKQLGIILVLLGLVGLFLPSNGLLLWAFGFGIMHIIYGLVMWVKYEQS
jgi:hypothetical protein